jgi:hypothetical protein
LNIVGAAFCRPREPPVSSFAERRGFFSNAAVRTQYRAMIFSKILFLGPGKYYIFSTLTPQTH